MPSRLAWPLLVVVAVLGAAPAPARACKCAKPAWDAFSAHPEQAKTRMLVKVTSEVDGTVVAETRGWSAQAPRSWKTHGTSCDLRLNEGTWYLVLDGADAPGAFSACSTLAWPVVEALRDSPATFAALERTWSREGVEPNPSWGLGCKVDADCEVSAPSGCIGELPVLRTQAPKVLEWRRNVEPRLSCTAPDASRKPATRAACRMGVCELGGG